MSEHRTLQIVRDHLTQPAAATSFDALRRVASQDTVACGCVRRLANQVGGLANLEALDAKPLPDDPFDWSVVAEADRPFAQGVVALVDEVCDRWLDVEYRTISRRLLARVLATDPKPVRRSSAPKRIAAGLVCAAVAGNLALGRRAGGWSASDIGCFFDTSSPGDLARTLVRAAQFDEVYRDEHRYDYPRRAQVLASPAFLHSRMRRGLLEQRVAAIAMSEREERERAGRRPMVDLGDGRLAVRGCLADIAVVHKGLSPSGRIMVLLGFTPLVPEPELEMFALSVPEAHRLALELQRALAAPPPQRGVRPVHGW